MYLPSKIVRLPKPNSKTPLSNVQRQTSDELTIHCPSFESVNAHFLSLFLLFSSVLQSLLIDCPSPIRSHPFFPTVLLLTNLLFPPLRQTVIRHPPASTQPRQTSFQRSRHTPDPPFQPSEPLHHPADKEKRRYIQNCRHPSNIQSERRVTSLGNTIRPPRDHRGPSARA